MTTDNTEAHDPDPTAEPLALRLNDQLGRAPWADDVEAWLEASNADEIEDGIDRYTLAEVARAVATERERCAKLAEQCSDRGQRHLFMDLAARIRGQRKCPGPACHGCIECDGY